MIKKFTLATLALFTASAPAFAHINPIEHGAFFSGVTHPLFGLDHVLVMVAVGLWAATLGRKAMLAVPAAFVAAMTLGFAAALLGVPLPFVEPVVLASVIFIGVMVALALPLPTAGVACIVAFFALFHGFAHGTELGTASAWPFAAGFVVATAMLHIAGIALALGMRKALPTSVALTRIAGTATAIGGLVLALAS